MPMRAFFTEQAMNVSIAGSISIAWLALIGAAPSVFATEAADRTAIEAAAQAWVKAFNARDIDGLMKLATDDLIVLSSNPSPATGARAREVWKRSAGVSQLPIRSVSKEIVVAGEVAWRISALSDATTQTQMLEIWQRVGGEWKIHRQMSSAVIAHSNLAPAPTEPVLDRPSN